MSTHLPALGADEAEHQVLRRHVLLQVIHLQRHRLRRTDSVVLFRVPKGVPTAVLQASAPLINVKTTVNSAFVLL